MVLAAPPPSSGSPIGRIMISFFLLSSSQVPPPRPRLLSFSGLLSFGLAFFVWLQAAANGATSGFGAYAALQRVRAFCAPTLTHCSISEHCSKFYIFAH